MKWMGIHHRLTQTKFRDLMMYGKPGALCSTLIRLSNTYGEELDDGGVLINKKITHTDLSNMIGATREREPDAERSPQEGRARIRERHDCHPRARSSAGRLPV